MRQFLLPHLGRWVVVIVLFFVFLISCTTPKKNRIEYQFLTESHGGFGAEANRDPLVLGHLFDLPVKFYQGNKKASTKHDKSWLGITMKLPEQIARDPETDEELSTIEVIKVFPKSPALKAGLMKDDQIIDLDGKSFEKGSEKILGDFRNTIKGKSVGSKVHLKILRNGGKKMVVPKLDTRLKGPLKLEPRPALEEKHGTYPNSLLHYVLEKENLTAEFKDVAGAIRNTLLWANSPYLTEPDFNPFRLQEVNYLMTYPFDFPIAAQQLTGDLHGGFAPNKKSLAKIMHRGMTMLDLQPIELAKPEIQPSKDLAGYIERLIRILGWALDERREALVKLDADDIDLLLQWAHGALKEELDEIEDKPEESKETTEEEKERQQKEKLRFLETALKLDLPRLLSAALAIADQIDLNQLSQLKADGPVLNRLGDGWIVHEEPNLTVIETPIGTVLVGGSESNVYLEDAILILDLGGDDYYLNRAGGSSLNFPFSIVIDFAGNDTYLAVQEYVQGSGLLGAGFLIDLEGNDRYIARNFAQGAGFFGVGALIDWAGNDEFRSDAFVQGAGAFGVGVLADGDGNDRYLATRFSQGFGFIKGVGMLIESTGADKYFAGGRYPDFRAPEKSYGSLSQGFGFGFRPGEGLIGTSGGIGILADKEGNDLYIGDYFSQGSSYWYALGILADEKGHDKYIAGRYSQGAGIHRSTALLWDAEGDDEYFADFGVSQGCGHDYAIGILLDNGGNDRYIGGLIAQGAGNDNGLGVLVDNGGMDEYHVKGLGRGWGNFHQDRKLPSFGIHFDTGGGVDYYSHEGKNDHLIFKTAHGIFADTR